MQRGATLLVVVGGDGSVNEVVNGVADLEGVELAVLPHGTGWDFVRTFGIPRELDEAVATALSGRRARDRPRARHATGPGPAPRAARTSRTSASAGISGAIAQRANETSKALGGKVSYYWATLAVFVGWQTGELRVSVDDEIRGGRMIDVMVANGRYLGGGMMMCPEAEPDDGLFDVLLIGDVTKRDLLVRAPEDLPREAPPAPAARGAARPRRHASTPTSRSRSSSTASSRGRRLRASRSCRGRCGCACPRPERRGQRSSYEAACAGARVERAGVASLQRRDLLLELRDARLERVDAAHLLAEVVDARAQVVERVERPLPARKLRDPLERLLARVGEPRDEILLSCAFALRRCRLVHSSPATTSMPWR